MNATPGLVATQRSFGRDLARSSDEQLSRVVALIDSMPERGKADELIAPLRVRLAQLRPGRPLRLTRVLFTPLEPVLVPPRNWRPGTATVPRSALTVVGEFVLGRMRGADDLSAMTAGCTVTDTDAVERIGALLWPSASTILREAPTPEGWTKQTGLADRFWPEIRDDAAAVLASAKNLAHCVRVHPAEDSLQNLVRPWSSQNQAPPPVVLKVLLARHPRADELLAEIGELRSPALVEAAKQAVSASLDGMDRLLDRIRVGGEQSAAAQLERLAGVLTAAYNPARHSQVQALRAEAVRVCETRLQAILGEDVPRLLLQAPAERAAAAMSHLEEAAREARKLEIVARRFDEQANLSAPLRDSASKLLQEPSATLDMIDRLRLLELLLGPDEAIAMCGLDTG